MPEIITGQDAAAEYDGGAEEAARVDAARAELVDEATGAPDGGLILGKYQSQEDLANAYISLQREYNKLKGGGAPAEAKAETSATVEATPEPAIEPDAQTQADQGKIALIQETIFNQVGGEAEYQRLSTWAAGNMPTERVNAYNKALEDGDQGSILNALKGLQYDYMMKHGYEPRLTGGRAPSTETRGYDSEAQVVQAMKDPRYSGDNPDPAYIKEVERKIAVSNVFQTR